MPENLPGVEYVGAGYDPLVEYANSERIVDTPFDWSKAPTNPFKYGQETYSKPTVISALSQHRSDIKITTGEDIQSYQSSLAASVKVEGSYNFFSGSLSSDFGEENLYKSENFFSRTQQSAKLWSLHLTVDHTTRDFLRDQFKDELDNLPTDGESCQKFFRRWGTHLLTGIMLGGRAVRTASTNKTQVDREYSLEVLATQSCTFATGSATGTESVKYKQAVSSFESSSEVHETIIGGDVVERGKVFKGVDGHGWEPWAKTVITQPALIDFLENPLTPIWELCASAGKGPAIRTALKNYYKAYAQLRSDELTHRTDFIDKLTVVTGHNWNTQPSSGYKRIDVDLNSGAGGRFVFAAYHKSRYDASVRNAKAVTDIRVVIEGDSRDNGDLTDYIKIPNDLNEGARGKYIYLYYKLGEYNPDTAILDLTVISSNTTWQIDPPVGYTKLDRDLNSGAGGKYMFFAYAKRNQSKTMGGTSTLRLSN